MVLLLKTIITDKWTCDFKKYGQNEFCECGICGDVVDPDCDESKNYSNSCGNMHCVNNMCAYPNDWTCDPARYNDGKVCDCNCTVFDPDCLLNVPVVGCEGEGMTCIRNRTTIHSVCKRAMCGDGVRDLVTGEECDGGEHCTGDCRCEPGFSPPSFSSVSCITICGDGVIAGDEECDSTKFCSETLCKCLPGHPLNAESGVCSGCGNGIVENDEECDATEGCTSYCRCGHGFRSSDGRCVSVDSTPIAIGCSVAAVILVAAAVAALLFYFVVVRGEKTVKEEEAAAASVSDIDSVIGTAAGPDSPWSVSPDALDFGFAGQKAPIGVPNYAKVMLTNSSSDALVYQIMLPSSTKFSVRANPSEGTVSPVCPFFFFLVSNITSPHLPPSRASPSLSTLRSPSSAPRGSTSWRPSAQSTTGKRSTGECG